jgi:chromate transporter
MTQLLALCWAFLKIGLVSFGGGWTIVGIIRSEVVGAGWLDQAQFADVIAIAQMTPGPVALNAATLVGYRIAGPLGSIAATISVLAFPLLFIALIFGALKRRAALMGAFADATRPVAAGMVAATLFGLCASTSMEWRTAFIAAAALVSSHFLKAEPLIVIFASGAAGVLLGMIPG